MDFLSGTKTCERDQWTSPLGTKIGGFLPCSRISWDVPNRYLEHPPQVTMDITTSTVTEALEATKMGIVMYSSHDWSCQLRAMQLPYSAMQCK